MWFVLLVVVAAVVFLGWRWLNSPDTSRPTPTRSATVPRPTSTGTGGSLFDLEAETERMLPAIMRQIEADAAAMMPEVEAEAARMHTEMMREAGLGNVPPTEPEPQPEPPVTLGPNVGPSWMSAAEWAERVAAYRKQGRTERAIREVAEHLERRGPYTPLTPAERIERAKSVDLVARAEYLSPEEEAEALTPGPDDFPDAWLERARDRLLVVTPRGWVNPRSRTAATRAGLWSFILRGSGHYDAAVKAGRFTPGAPVRLVREPNNPHDPNAIAVYAGRARNKAGYVPRGTAKRLAKVLDSGADMVAVSVRGSGAGSDTVTPVVLVVERALWDHLNSKR